MINDLLFWLEDHSSSVIANSTMSDYSSFVANHSSFESLVISL